VSSPHDDALRPRPNPVPAAPTTADDDVARALRLARLSVDDASRADAAREFQGLLAAFAELRDIDVDGVEPLFSPTTRIDVVREDVVAPSLERDELLRNAPAPRGGFFGVPKTIGGDA